MQTIASTDFYRIDVDEAKNRMYITYKGSWLKSTDAAEFADRHKEALARLKPGFTVFVDVRPMESMLLTDRVEQVQRDAVAAGIRKAARVYDKESFIKVQADRINLRTGISSMAFYDPAAAEAWLDEEE